MDFKTLYSELQNKIFQPVYLLTGEETFFIDKISQYIEDELLNEEQKAFDFQIFYGKDSKALDIISALKQYPLVGEKRLVILKEAQQLRDFKTLGTYLKSPLESTVFVICYKGKPIDKRSALYKNLSKSVVFFYSKALYDNQAAIWAKEELQTRGYTISPPALELLLEKTGSKIQYIDNELSKLQYSCSYFFKWNLLAFKVLFALFSSNVKLVYVDFAGITSFIKHFFGTIVPPVSAIS
ncbi:MAG: DNA polymerase III subunit delta [Flavobacteriales bacterium]